MEGPGTGDSRTSQERGTRETSRWLGWWSREEVRSVRGGGPKLVRVLREGTLRGGTDTKVG